MFIADLADHALRALSFSTATCDRDCGLNGFHFYLRSPARPDLKILIYLSTVRSKRSKFLFSHFSTKTSTSANCFPSSLTLLSLQTSHLSSILLHDRKLLSDNQSPCGPSFYSPPSLGQLSLTHLKGVAPFQRKLAHEQPEDTPTPASARGRAPVPVLALELPT